MLGMLSFLCIATRPGERARTTHASAAQAVFDDGTGSGTTGNEVSADL